MATTAALPLFALSLLGLARFGGDVGPGAAVNAIDVTSKGVESRVIRPYMVIIECLEETSKLPYFLPRAPKAEEAIPTPTSKAPVRKDRYASYSPSVGLEAYIRLGSPSAEVPYSYRFILGGRNHPANNTRERRSRPRDARWRLGVGLVWSRACRPGVERGLEPPSYARSAASPG
jgi:hypothetical protein